MFLAEDPFRFAKRVAAAYRLRELFALKLVRKADAAVTPQSAR